jgi:hypothetical protein
MMHFLSVSLQELDYLAFGLPHAPMVVYGPPVLLDDDRTIGYGPTHQEAKENSARKLFQLGYCVSPNQSGSSL